MNKSDERCVQRTSRGNRITKLAEVIVRRDPEEESGKSNNGIEKIYGAEECRYPAVTILRRLHGKHDEKERREDGHSLHSVFPNPLGRVPSCRASRSRSCGGREAPSRTGTGTPTCSVQPLRVSNERVKVLQIRVVYVDGPNATFTASPDIVIPDGPVPVCLCNLNAQCRFGGSIDGVAEAGVEAVEGGVRVVNGDTGCGEGGFYNGMCPIRKIENDEITNIRLDLMGLEDQAGILSGAISTDYDGYRFGGGK